MSALHAYLEQLQRAAAARGSELAPDDDWWTTASIESFDGHPTVLVIDNAFMENAATKNMLAELLAKSALQLRAVRVGFTNGVWMVKRDRDDPDETLPADDPNRVEALEVWAIDLDEALYSFAEVHRQPGRPPTLGEWTVVDDGVDGRFLNAVRLAIHWVRGMAEDPIALLRSLQPMADATGTGEVMAELIELGERDPEMVAAMPIRQWWQRERGAAS